MTTDTTATDTQETPETPETISLGASDLGTYLRIIEVACTRGAFRAEEMTQIGIAHDKLKAFLAQITPAAPEDGEDGSTSEGDK